MSSREAAPYSWRHTQILCTTVLLKVFDAGRGYARALGAFFFLFGVLHYCIVCKPINSTPPPKKKKVNRSYGQQSAAQHGRIHMIHSLSE